MGRLIGFYKVFINDLEFIKLLNTLKTKRDNLAHRGYLLYMDELIDSNELDQMIQELKDDLEIAKQCLNRIYEEGFKLEKIVNKKN